MELRLLFEKDIRDLVGPKEAYEAVRDAFIRLAKGQAVLPGVINLDIPGTRTEAHVKGAYLQGMRHFAVKVASGSYDNPSRGLPSGGGMFLVFDATTGLPVAVLFDNGYLTDVRTGAAGALAADLLAKTSIDRVGIVGVGSQARYQLEALLGVRRPKAVVAWGRDRGKAEAYADEMTSKHKVPVEAVGSVEVACRGSDVVVTVTPVHEPLVQANWVDPGTHVTAVGADSPDKQELDVEVLRKADKVVADRLEQCLRLGEIHHAVEAGALRKEDVHAELGEIAAGMKRGRESDEEITVADLTGVGVQDAAVANRAVMEAIRRRLGQVLDV
jgi:ornithine cyclodeaminase